MLGLNILTLLAANNQITVLIFPDNGRGINEIYFSNKQLHGKCEGFS